MAIKSFDTELTQEEIEDFVASLIQGGDKISVVYDDTGNTLDIGTSAQDTEEVQDIVASLLKGGNAISFSYDDPANALTAAVVESGISLGNLGSKGHGELTGIGSSDHHPRFTNEEAQDTVANMLGGGDAITLNYDDASNRLTINASASVIRTDSNTALTIETRTSDPTSPANGRMWLRTDL